MMIHNRRQKSRGHHRTLLRGLFLHQVGQSAPLAGVVVQYLEPPQIALTAVAAVLVGGSLKVAVDVVSGLLGELLEVRGLHW
jgi:hypothetical protein